MRRGQRVDRGEDDRVERRVREPALAEEREVAGVREALRHPLVAELVHEDERAVHPADEERVQGCRHRGKAEENGRRGRGGKRLSRGRVRATQLRPARNRPPRPRTKCDAGSGGTTPPDEGSSPVARLARPAACREQTSRVDFDLVVPTLRPIGRARPASSTRSRRSRTGAFGSSSSWIKAAKPGSSRSWLRTGTESGCSWSSPPED